MPSLPTDTAQLGSLLWGAAVRVKETVAESIDGNLHEFNAERERVLAEARRLQPVTSGDASSEGLPPWRVLSEQYQILEEDLRTQMLQLSLTQSTFIEAPSSGSPAVDYKALLPTCMAALREDEALRQRRFELVPKRLDERTFWANYLDKVFAIKDAILATSVHLNSIGHGEEPPSASRAGRGPQPQNVRSPGAQASTSGAAPAPTFVRAASRAADAMSERIRAELEAALLDDADTDAGGREQPPRCAAPVVETAPSARTASAAAPQPVAQPTAPRRGSEPAFPNIPSTNPRAEEPVAEPAPAPGSHADHSRADSSLAEQRARAAAAPGQAATPQAADPATTSPPPQALTAIPLPHAAAAAAATPPPAAAPTAPTADAGRAAEADGLEDDGELEDDGVELNSDDDIDKLLDLGDDDDGEDEDAR